MIQPSRVETINVASFHPAWQSGFTIEIAGSCDKAIALDKVDANSCRFYADGYGYEGELVQQQ
jgi:hypothetical protein